MRVSTNCVWWAQSRSLWQQRSIFGKFCYSHRSFSCSRRAESKGLAASKQLRLCLSDRKRSFDDTCSSLANKIAHMIPSEFTALGPVRCGAVCVGCDPYMCDSASICNVLFPGCSFLNALSKPHIALCFAVADGVAR